MYGKEVFPEPQSALTEVPKLLGIDGRKMSKSYKNAIYISDSKDVLEKKVMITMTDPARKRREDKGHPEVCTVYSLHEIFSKPQLGTIAHECREALRGCTDCKKELFKNMSTKLKPIHEKRAELEKDPKALDEILEMGSDKARHHAQQTLREVREVMGL
jgi:tryptophanyl-tRNA synthetase